MNTHLFWKLTGGRVHSFWIAENKSGFDSMPKWGGFIFVGCFVLSFRLPPVAHKAEPSINIQLTQCGMWNSFAWLLRDGETRRASWANQPWNYMRRERKRKKKPVSHTLGNWFASRPGRQSVLYTQLPPAVRYKSHIHHFFHIEMDHRLIFVS